jgi:hypothetical protein
MIFGERNAQLLSREGVVGLVFPSAFHANEGATGLRRFYLDEMSLHCCYSFENRRKLCEIDSRLKFATVVASRTGPTTEFPCAFYLHDDEWLFGDRGDRELRYTLDSIHRTGGAYLSFLELRSQKDLEVAEACFLNGELFGDVCNQFGIKLSQELNMTYDSWRFTPTAEVLPSGEAPRDPDVAQCLLEMGYLALHEEKTFHQFTDRWEERPNYLIPLGKLHDKPEWIKASLYFRTAYRAVASSTNERTIVFHILPAGGVFGNSAPVERLPGESPRHRALQQKAAANTKNIDWSARVRAGANINQFILFSCPLPKMVQINNFLRDQVLRLSANHAGYKPLWHEQLGDVWREQSPPFTWPVFAGEDERWAVRATIDAVVADTYGLSREQYAHVLSTFSHRSYPKAPELCLARYDKLKAIGTEAFTRKYDPYWDIPLNENLPEPVIDLPIAEVASEGNGNTASQQEQLLWLAAEPEASQYQPSTPRPSSLGPAAPRRTQTAAADDETYALLKLLLKEQGVITSSDAQDCTGLDAASVRYMLKRLIDEGIAVQEGQKRGTKYCYVRPENLTKDGA